MKMNNNIFTIEKNLSAVVDTLCGIRNYAHQCRVVDDAIHGVCEGLPFVPDVIKPFMDPNTIITLSNWEPYKLACTMKKVYEMLIDYHVDTATIKKVMKQMMDHNRTIDPYNLIGVRDNSSPVFMFFDFYSRPDSYIDAYNNAHPGQHQVSFTNPEDKRELTQHGLLITSQSIRIMTREDVNLIWRWVFSLKEGDPYFQYIGCQSSDKLEVTDIPEQSGEDELHRILGE